MADQYGGNGHPGFFKLLNELAELHSSKNADYGTGADPFANFRKAAELGVPPWVGAMVRLEDKVSRVESFLKNGRLNHEGVEDSLKDLAAYALIALVLYREGRPGEPAGAPMARPAGWFPGWQAEAGCDCSCCRYTLAGGK